MNINFSQLITYRSRVTANRLLILMSQLIDDATWTNFTTGQRARGTGTTRAKSAEWRTIPAIRLMSATALSFTCQSTIHIGTSIQWDEHKMAAGIGSTKLLLTEMFSTSPLSGGMCRNRSMSQPRIPRLLADEPNWWTLQPMGTHTHTFKISLSQLQYESFQFIFIRWECHTSYLLPDITVFTNMPCSSFLTTTNLRINYCN